MSRLSRRLLPAAVLLAAACSGSSTPLATDPTPPAAPAPGVSAFVAQNCSAEQVTTLVNDLLPKPLALTLSVVINQLRTQATSGQRDKAQATALKLVDQLLKARQGGLFANDPVRQKRLATLIQLILCVADLSQPALDLSASGGAAVIPAGTTTPTTVTTGDKLAGVTVPAGAVVQTTLVTVTPTAPGVGPLNTDLDQYPLFYEFSASPSAAFTQKVTVGVCTQGDVTSIFPRLRLAHNVGPNIGDIEVLPKVDAPFLDCTNADLLLGARDGHSTTMYAGWKALKRSAGDVLASVLLPTPAYASSMVVKGCCLGGLAGSFSPFGAVDTASIEIDSVGAGSVSAAAGTVVTPQVVVRKIATAKARAGLPARGIDVTFAVTSGSGSATPLTARSGETGLVSTAWTVAAGANSLTASAVNGRASTAGGTTSVVPGSPLTFKVFGSSAAPFDYGADGWKTQQIGETSPFNPAWTANAFYDASWTVGKAAFGMQSPPDTYCGFYNPNAASTLTFAPNSSIALRRRFTLPGGATAGQLGVAIDNDVKVYVNGVLQTSALVNGAPVAADANGVFVHEGCPSNDSFVFPLSGLSATDNVLTVIAIDRGGSTYFDAAVRVPPPAP